LQPVGLLSVFVVIYTTAVITFLKMPALAYKVALILTVAVCCAACIVILCSWLIFPEFCIDQVSMAPDLNP
jgi:hypothetical protein